jgi:PAS domain S-box-containing protein
MSNLIGVYVVTGLVSLVVAILLVNFARASIQGKLANTKTKPALDIELSTPEVSSLKEIITSEIRNSSERKLSQQVIDKIANTCATEFAKNVTWHDNEIKKKYDNIVSEKVKSEEIAWRKYNKTLSDKKNTEAVIRSIAEGLVVVDAEGKVVLMNPAAERLLNVSKKDKVGKPITSSLKEEHLISLAKGNTDQQDKEIELISEQDETKQILRASSAVIENENGQTVGMVSVLSDVTKQKELDKLKSNFVAGVTHELRTPLVAIDKSISLILTGTMGTVPDNLKELLVIAERNIKRLSKLINDLLDMSKFESGRVELKKENFSIKDIVFEAISTLEIWAQNKKIKIETNLAEDLPQVYVDKDKIIQVLINLIGNAIKFTPQDGLISVRVSKVSSGGIEVCVKDNGIGIAEENLGKIFDKFFQVGERTSSDIGGTGLGLSIAKEIINLHSGRIWAESKKDEVESATLELKTFLSNTQSEGEGIAFLLKEIEALANKASVYLIDLKPAGVKDTIESKKYIISVTCEAQMEQLFEFMYSIESANRLLLIEKFQILPKAKDSSVARCIMTISQIIIS